MRSKGLVMMSILTTDHCNAARPDQSLIITDDMGYIFLFYKRCSLRVRGR